MLASLLVATVAQQSLFQQVIKKPTGNNGYEEYVQAADTALASRLQELQQALTAPEATATPAAPATRTIDGDVVNTRFGPVQVQITLSGSTITAVKDLQYPNGSGRDIEINDQAFRRCRDLMIASAIAFQAELAALIEDMQGRGLIRLRPGIKADALAQLLADGARGTNQSLPPTDPETLKLRYRAMVGAIIHGTAMSA